MGRIIRVNLKNRWVSIILSNEEVEKYYLEWFKYNTDLITKTLLYAKNYLKNVNELTEDEKKIIYQKLISDISTPFVYFLEEKIYEKDSNDL